MLNTHSNIKKKNHNKLKKLQFMDLMKLYEAFFVLVAGYILSILVE